ncbi:MAG: hypothetical protein IPK81_18270 [Rhodospirillales bacterium]|nr:MAG: hypothetical protein IPK81_18270 [Rhodospirillales bacterium]
MKISPPLAIVAILAVGVVALGVLAPSQSPPMSGRAQGEQTGAAAAPAAADAQVALSTQGPTTTEGATAPRDSADLVAGAAKAIGATAPAAPSSLSN